jgi:L-iditol 2-dehydrogenase
MIEPLAVGVHVVKRAGDIKDQNVIVLGAGPIGNLVAQAAKSMGAAKVMITDIVDYRLEKAKECGIDICINTKDCDFGQIIAEHFGPDKADVIIDCAGTNITMGQAIRYSRKGSLIILVAVFDQLAEVDLAIANDKELCINNSMMYTNEDYIDAIDLVASNKVSLKPLISKHFPFLEYKKAYEFIDEEPESVMKVIIDVG